MSIIATLEYLIVEEEEEIQGIKVTIAIIDTLETQAAILVLTEEETLDPKLKIGERKFYETSTILTEKRSETSNVKISMLKRRV